MVITISHTGLHQADPGDAPTGGSAAAAGAWPGWDTKEDDWVEHLFIASTHDYLMFFTDRGQVYWLKVHEIPQGGPRRAGQAGGQLHRHRAARDRWPRRWRCASSPTTGG